MLTAQLSSAGVPSSLVHPDRKSRSAGRSVGQCDTITVTWGVTSHGHVVLKVTCMFAPLGAGKDAE